ncbi:hypothetical protein SETIT_2G224700v2 [Setaria italica]|uniref:Zinc finger PHD-type domain-containing protein n=1 Tax=Setaria italica TaxID=4555 RepID=A0A368Q1K2_SETIT|nr:PHD finger protein PERSISTENT TAPETAL CELL 1 [Setaria italica]RCV11911.1 hypothetical protein SETIT_2G224700v2 [Setaria italica]
MAAANDKAMVISLGSSRRRKRGEMLFRFESFCQPGYPAPLPAGAAFKDNVRALLGLAHLEAGAQGETRCWSFQLELHRHPPTVVRLFVVEEEVGVSPQRQCHLCRHVGWGRHLICSKRFHFVLPKRELSVEADGLHYGINHGSEKPSKGTATSRGHLLHGVVHLNGFGHLVALHGFEGGSDFIAGHQIMDLWDRMCAALNVRMVSLVDTARKGHMELRLLHGVAYGGTWFGRWGYRFGRPSYGVALPSYQQSLHALQSVPLCVLVPHLSCFSQDLPVVVAKYQAISGHKLLGLGDLLRFMLELQARLPAASVTAMDYRGIMSEASCRWSAKRVDMAARAVVDALRRRAEPSARWVTRQEVRDAARAYIGDTGLLDFVLKSLGNHIVGNYVVRRAMNPVTKVLEYCLEDVSSVLPAAGSVPSGGCKVRVRFQLTRAQLMRDLAHLYRHVLKEPSQALTAGALGAIPVAVRMVLDTKHFVKDYHEGFAPVSSVGAGHVHISLCCTLLVRDGTPELVAPYETVTLPAHATVGELKWEVQRLFREMYLGLRTFTAESVVGVGVSQDACPVLGLIDVGSAVVVEGYVGEQQQQLAAADEGVLPGNEVAAVSEGGCDGERVVDCVCGADDDDGERMACCDICEAWQHTRCAGIKDTDDVPHVFVCSRCDNDVLSFPPLA